MSNSFKREIYGLTVQGEFHPDMDGVQVTVDYKDKTREVFPVLNQFLTEHCRNYPFSYIPGTQVEPAARGLLTFDRDSSGHMRLTLSLTAPVEETVTFEPSQTEPPGGQQCRLSRAAGRSRE